MRRIPFIICLIISIVFIIEGCGGNLFINKEYDFVLSNPKVQLAIIPVSGNNMEIIDSIFVLFFNDSARPQDLITPEVIRDQISSDIQLTEILNKLGSVEYSKDDFNQNPSILNTLTDNEFTYMQEKLGNPDIALFPVSFNIKSLGPITSGFVKIRLYDFENGNLIYESSQSLNVELGGEDGKKHMVLGLIALTKDDYNKYFWYKFVNNI